MSLRYTGAWMQDGAFNPLTAPTPTYAYNLFAWGSNSGGVLGLSNTTNYSSPKQSGSSIDWSKISAAPSRQVYAIKTNGTLWAWGYNDSGSLGQNNTTSYSSPKQVGSLTNWIQVSGAYNSFGAIKTDGTLWTCGANASGQLALGNTTWYSSPVQVGSLTNWKSVYFSLNNACFAIKTDNSLWAWGYNYYGQLGFSTNVGSYSGISSPTQVGALTNWLSVSSGYGHSIAVKTDGTLWGWGSNNTGQLGLGNRTNYSSPKQIGALTNWSSSACGYDLSLAVKTDGTLWSWGRNNNGQLGFGNTTNYSSPKQVGSLTNWLNVSSSGYNSVSIKTDGTLWTWGRNTSGQGGLGNTTNYSSPKQVGSLTTWTTISSGGNFVIAIG